MSEINYLKFNEINQNEFLALVNSSKLRKHLIEHELFTSETLKNWMNAKMEVDAMPGCKVRGIVCKSELAGWCGIQFENKKYEIAIIIDDKFWGLGKKVFQEMMRWAKEMGHTEVTINLLNTRREYKFLKNVANSVSESEILGNKFTSYQLLVR